MLSFAGSVRVFLAVEPCDLRKGFEGLLSLVGQKLGEDVKSGALFVFTNARHTRLKVLYFDGSGLWVCAKRLEKGRFCWPKESPAEAGAHPGRVLLGAEEWTLLLGGIDLAQTRRRKWWRHEPGTALEAS